MTKRSTKLVIVALAAAFLVPASVKAQGNADFCTQQNSRLAMISENFQKRMEAYDAAMHKQTENRKTSRERLGAELAEAREDADERREESQAAITDRQQTNEAKAAAQSYAEEVKSAVTKRRQAYDDARAVFHQSVDALLTSRDTEMRSAVQVYRETAESAVEIASEACSDRRGDHAAVRASMIKQMREARLAYADKLRARQDFRAGVREAASVRTESFKLATKEFQQSMQDLRTKYSQIKQ